MQLPYLVLFNRLQGVSSGQVRVERIEDQECLVIREQIEDRTYETVFYVQAGQLMELLRQADKPVDLSAGERLAASDPIRFELQGSQLRLQWQREAGTAALSLELKEGAEDVYKRQDQGFLKLLFQLVKKRFSIPAFCGQRRPLRNEDVYKRQVWF